MKNTDWYVPLAARLNLEYLEKIDTFIENIYADDAKIYPPKDKIFLAIKLTPLAKTKVIIVGQDPYPQENKAQGLAFSYPADFIVKRADSIINIQKELANEGIAKKDSDLTNWATQGVLLLNAVLTVPDNQPNAHAGLIWEPLTDEIIKVASDDERPKVFILWGNFARKKAKLIDRDKHLIIESAHPSPLSASRGFFGSQPFLRANAFLEEHNQTAIKWEL